MLTKRDVNDLDNCLLKQCPGPPDCACRFCKTRHALAAYSRVVALLDDIERTVRIPSLIIPDEKMTMLRDTATRLRRALEG